MKKLLLLSATVFVANLTYAQSGLQANEGSQFPLSHPSYETENAISKLSTGNSLAKTTGLSDTFYRVNGAQYDSLFTSAAKFYYMGATLPLDSGFVFGVNAPGWTGFAGRFKFNSQPDTTMKIIGVLAVFGGNYQSTTKTIDLKVWGLDTNNVTVTTTRKMKNLPGTTLATLTRTINTIGINNSGNDTIKEYYFPTAVSNVTSNFFVGYEMSYQWTNLGGDSIAAYSCTQGLGWGHGEIHSVIGTDTMINAQTAVKDGGVWKDTYMQLGYDKLNMSIVPIFQYSGTNVFPSEVGGVTYNNLTFYGHYPNPAIDNINIKFALQNSASVSLIVRDITGKTVATIPTTKYNKGEHVISLKTANLAVGNYVYLIHTSEGDAMAAQITIVK